MNIKLCSPSTCLCACWGPNRTFWKFRKLNGGGPWCTLYGTLSSVVRFHSGIVTLFVGNDIFVASMCICCNTTIISNSFAMLMSSISFTQHHNLFIVCKKCTYIVYIVHIERNMHIASVFSVRPPFLMFGNIVFAMGILLHDFQRSTGMFRS